MRVAMISNTAWLDEELMNFQPLVVGLVADGVQVVQVVPEGLTGTEGLGFGERMTWADTAWPSLRRFRLGRLAGPLEEVGVDLIHALDGRVWEGSLRLAQRLGVPAILMASSKLDLPVLDQLKSRVIAAHATVVATTEPLAAAMRKALGEAGAVEVIPPGVHHYEEAAPPAAGSPGVSPAPSAETAPIPATPETPVRPAGGVFCAAVCSSGVFDSDCQSFFEALPPIIADYPQSQFFIDGQGRDQHPLWQAARRYDLLANISMVPRRLGRRELLLMADLIIQPQPLGRSRGLTLQAMARGVPVLACQDPWVDYLVDGETAWLLDRPQPARWEELIRRAVGDKVRARELGNRARQWIRPRHSASGQVLKTLGLYRKLTGTVIRFPRPA